LFPGFFAVDQKHPEPFSVFVVLIWYLGFGIKTLTLDPRFTVSLSIMGTAETLHLFQWLKTLDLRVR
jgi:hypothetical protein